MAATCGSNTLPVFLDDIQCKKCPKGQWSLVSSINCTDPTFEYLTWRQPEALGLILAAAVLIACHASVGILFLKHRGTPLVRASGGALSGLSLLCLTASCLSLGLFLGQPGNTACRLQMPLNSIFPTVALATITVIALEVGAAGAAWENTSSNQSINQWGWQLIKRESSCLATGRLLVQSPCQGVPEQDTLLLTLTTLLLCMNVVNVVYG